MEKKGAGDEEFRRLEKKENGHVKAKIFYWQISISVLRIFMTSKYIFFLYIYNNYQPPNTQYFKYP